jgi:hypothetical protein
VQLQFCAHLETGNFIFLIRLHDVELDLGANLAEVDRKMRRGHLQSDTGFEMRMTAVHDDAVAGNVNRHKKWQAHQVVPVQMGDKDMIGLWFAGSKLRHLGLPEWTQTAAQVANDMFGRLLRGFANHLDAGGVAAITAADREGKRVGEGFNLGG